MDVFFNKRFVKQYNKLSKKVQHRFDERLDTFQNNPRNRTLNLHTVSYQGDIFVSINVTGDCRALFLWESEDRVRFYRVGTHSQLYG